MADSIDEVIEGINNRLYDNIIGGNFNEFASSFSVTTKERAIKDYYLKLTKQLFEELNKEFKDVRFLFKWQAEHCYLNSEMQWISRDSYDMDYPADRYDLDEIYDEDEGLNHFYGVSLQSINIKIEYFWERKCSLGCLHSKKRFYIINMPKLIDLVGYFKLGMPVRTLVKEFIPDFFYDPMQPPKKRGRPKSSRS